MILLGIESSCDDTSVALVEATDNGFHILSEKTASQIDVHKKYGGVVPEIAAREHAEAIFPVIEAVMSREAGSRYAGEKPDCISVTAGPGLITSLLVGAEAAKSLSYLWDIPLVAVNHIEGHIHSVELHEARSIKHEALIEFPALALVVSGGHTELILMRDHGEYQRIGRTLDDAAGECFDKVAKLLGFDYPGGPKISNMVEGGNAAAIDFPRPMLKEENYDFSFAGLKTSALYWLRDNTLSAFHVNPVPLPAGIFGQTPDEPTINDFCASFEQAIVDVLVAKTMRAAKQYNPKSVLLVGGVAANKKLRSTLEQSIASMLHDTCFMIPDLRYCMDNGAMIAVAGSYKARKKEYTRWQDLTADPQWRL